MNLWARYDEEDKDYIHFSAQVNTRVKTRRLICSVHIGDLELLFGERGARHLCELLARDTKVSCSFDIWPESHAYPC